MQLAQGVADPYRPTPQTAQSLNQILDVRAHPKTETGAGAGVASTGPTKRRSVRRGDRPRVVDLRAASPHQQHAAPPRVCSTRGHFVSRRPRLDDVPLSSRAHQPFKLAARLRQRWRVPTRRPYHQSQVHPLVTSQSVCLEQTRRHQPARICRRPRPGDHPPTSLTLLTFRPGGPRCVTSCPCPFVAAVWMAT